MAKADSLAQVGRRSVIEQTRTREVKQKRFQKREPGPGNIGPVFAATLHIGADHEGLKTI